MDSGFNGFPADSFVFFRQLAKKNHKLWFDQNRSRYEQVVTEPFRALLRALEPFLLQLNPNFETIGKTNRNFSRINRDIRFSKDRTPYKLNYYLYIFDGRRKRTEDGRLYIGLNSDCVTVGFSIYAVQGCKAGASLDRIFRQRLSHQPAVFDRLLKQIVRARRYESYWYRKNRGEWVQQSGFPSCAEDRQVLQGWVVRKLIFHGSRHLGGPSFLRRVEQIFRELYPLYVFTSGAGKWWRSELEKLESSAFPDRSPRP